MPTMVSLTFAFAPIVESAQTIARSNCAPSSTTTRSPIDRWSGDAHVFAYSRVRADPDVRVDLRARRDLRRRIRAARARVRNREAPVHQVGACAPVLFGRSDIAPIRIARIEAVEGQMFRLAAPEKRLCRNRKIRRRECARRSPARTRRCRCSRVCCVPCPAPVSLGSRVMRPSSSKTTTPY